ncbi:hypothetical protein U9M48_030652 [Paspalum notatum var. saurae]|uniref:F-box domain-containing protein n=1 Tax=Paspalum notatum var. saurae TaxID=547442 RepID=A0AAQ3U595_PASNO
MPCPSFFSTQMRGRRRPASPTEPDAFTTQKRGRRPCPPTATIPTAVPQPDWSLLAPDLIRRVGECILAADDIDYYMAFRVVCHNWRAAIKDHDHPAGTKKADDCDDPRRFRPSKWTLVDRDDDALVTLVNMETGRFVRKRTPLLRDYFFTGASRGGLVLLAERAHPYQARVLPQSLHGLTRPLQGAGSSGTG